jgi:hypothetical protein
MAVGDIPIEAQLQIVNYYNMIGEKVALSTDQDCLQFTAQMSLSHSE